MATEWYHNFNPSFSGVLLVTFVALLAFAFISGVKSVKLRPRKKQSRNCRQYEDAPRYFSKKTHSFRENYRANFRGTQEVADVVICFCSDAVDIFLSVVACIAFIVVFAKEHYDGLTQLIINNLTASDAAVNGDIWAAIIIVFSGAIVGFMFYLFRALGQYLRGDKLIRAYLFSLRKRPMLHQTPSPKFMIDCLIWAIGKEIEEKKERKAAKHLEAIRRAEEALEGARVIRLDRSNTKAI